MLVDSIFMLFGSSVGFMCWYMNSARLLLPVRETPEIRIRRGGVMPLSGLNSD